MEIKDRFTKLTGKCVRRRKMERKDIKTATKKNSEEKKRKKKRKKKI